MLITNKQTDGQSDTQTDRLTYMVPCSSMMYAYWANWTLPPVRQYHLKPARYTWEKKYESYAFNFLDCYKSCKWNETLQNPSFTPTHFPWPPDPYQDNVHIDIRPLKEYCKCIIFSMYNIWHIFFIDFLLLRKDLIWWLICVHLFKPL